MKPSTAAVLALLRDYGELGVTPRDALEVVGSFRLAARIIELRREGFDVRTEWVKGPRKSRYAKYVIHERPEQVSLWDNGAGGVSTESNSIPAATVAVLLTPGAGRRAASRE